MSTLSLSPLAGKTLTPKSLATVIDHTLLKPDATREQIVRLCEEAVQHGFACAFVQPTWTALAAGIVHGSAVKVGVPVGFPQGVNFTSVKRFEALEALKLGAHDIDMVLNIGALKTGDHALVESDIRGVAEVTHAHGGILKVILETSLLTLEEKLISCQLAVNAGADFVKTSTGFAGGGATIDDIALMRGVVGEKIGVKASGGVRTLADAIAMIEAGANRIGTSAGLAILGEAKGEIAR